MIEKTRAVVRKYGPKVGAAVMALPLTVGVALAQTASTPLEVAQNAVDESKTTLTTVALAILGLVVAVWAIFKVIAFFGRK